jgi:hypothetical protein
MDRGSSRPLRSRHVPEAATPSSCWLRKGIPSWSRHPERQRASGLPVSSTTSAGSYGLGSTASPSSRWAHQGCGQWRRFRSSAAAHDREQEQAESDPRELADAADEAEGDASGGAEARRPDPQRYVASTRDCACPMESDGLRSPRELTAPDRGMRALLRFGLRRLPPLGAILGYLVFTTGALLVAWPAWTHRSQQENPSLVLLIVWLVAGISHIVVRDFWRACKISAFWSVLVYIALVVFTNAVNEMFVAGMMLVAVAGYILAIVLGVPVASYRRERDDSGSRTSSGRR